MEFNKLSKYWERLEGKASRLAMMEVLAELLKEASLEEVAEVCYLSMGRLGPLYDNTEFNLAEKLMIRSVSQAYNVGLAEAKKGFKSKGDLGVVVEELAKRVGKRDAGSEKFEAGKSDDLKKESASEDSRSQKIPLSKLKKSRFLLFSSQSVSSVYEQLLRIAKEEGAGSQERKLKGIAKLLRSLDPISAKFVARIPIKKMRLGFSDKTVLDALSFMRRGDKSGKKDLEDAYKVRPDVGALSQIVKEKGIKGVKNLREPKVGVPVLMAQAKRMSSASEILEQIGECAIESKIDGFRLQIHRSSRAIKLFTRNLDDVTYMYPDIVKAVEEELDVEEIIFEGEAVAFDPKTKKLLPFQETMQRKRKYGIEEMAKEKPLRLIAFEILYLNGESLIDKSYVERRVKLESVIAGDFSGTNFFLAQNSPSASSADRSDMDAHANKKGAVQSELSQTVEPVKKLSPSKSKAFGGIIVPAKLDIVGDEKKIDRLFDKAVGEGYEGVMAKRLDAPYTAGARNWNWIKYKKSYSSKLADTLDCLVMGYDFGKGKRAEFGIGGFLAGVYDEKKEKFVTVSKVGTGLTDKQWRELKVRSKKLEAGNRPGEYATVKEAEVDVWIEPKIVVEIEVDEITKSPTHTAGLALRFPRLKRFRDDKRVEQVTTVKELGELYKLQRK